MRPVNLLPERYRVRGARPGRPVRAYAVIGVLGALLVLVLAYTLTARQVTERGRAIAEAQAERQRAEARAGALSELVAAAEGKDARVRVVARLARERWDWERLVRELAHVLPHRVRLTELSATRTAEAASASTAPAVAPGGPTLTLTGCSPNQPEVAKMLVRLRRLHGAQDVTLQSSERKEESQGGSAPTGDSAGGPGQAECQDFEFNVSVAFAAKTPPDGGKVPDDLGGGR
jgi:Tfp pilus assembly protein PilN